MKPRESTSIFYCFVFSFFFIVLYVKVLFFFSFVFLSLLLFFCSACRGNNRRSSSTTENVCTWQVFFIMLLLWTLSSKSEHLTFFIFFYFVHHLFKNIELFPSCVLFFCVCACHVIKKKKNVKHLFFFLLFAGALSSKRWFKVNRGLNSLWSGLCETWCF